MSGAYNGVTAKISSAASLHVHTWCYSHCLSLLSADVASACTQAMTLLGFSNPRQDVSSKLIRGWTCGRRCWQEKGALQEGLVQLERLGAFQNPFPLKRSLVTLKAQHRAVHRNDTCLSRNFRGQIIPAVNKN